MSKLKSFLLGPFVWIWLAGMAFPMTDIRMGLTGIFLLIAGFIGFWKWENDK